MSPIKHEIKKVLMCVDGRGSMGKAKGGYRSCGNILYLTQVLFPDDSMRYAYLSTFLSIAVFHNKKQGLKE